MRKEDAGDWDRTVHRHDGTWARPQIPHLPLSGGEGAGVFQLGEAAGEHRPAVLLHAESKRHRPDRARLFRKRQDIVRDQRIAGCDQSRHKRALARAAGAAEQPSALRRGDCGTVQ